MCLAHPIPPEAEETVPQRSGHVGNLGAARMSGRTRAKFYRHMRDTAARELSLNDPLRIGKRTARNKRRIENLPPPELDAPGVLSVHAEQDSRQYVVHRCGEPPLILVLWVAGSVTYWRSS